MLTYTLDKQAGLSLYEPPPVAVPVSLRGGGRLP